jgi:hypothetical protein
MRPPSQENGLFIVRRYTALLPHMLYAICLNVGSWAQAARYGTTSKQFGSLLSES